MTKLPHRVRTIASWWNHRNAVEIVDTEWPAEQGGTWIATIREGDSRKPWVHVLTHAPALRDAIIVEGQIHIGHPWRAMQLAIEFGMHLVVGIWDGCHQVSCDRCGGSVPS